MKPRSINIFLLDGDPNGIRVAQISMSTIQAIAFRRNQLRRVREAFPEIERPGVYILIGSDEDAQDRQLAYIGESEGVGARLSYHNSNEAGRDAKGFWTDTADGTSRCRCARLMLNCVFWRFPSLIDGVPEGVRKSPETCAARFWQPRESRRPSRGWRWRIDEPVATRKA
jgi:hypothetical protein